jgi:anti-sigma factor RsiW
LAARSAELITQEALQEDARVRAREAAEEAEQQAVQLAIAQSLEVPAPAAVPQVPREDQSFPRIFDLIGRALFVTEQGLRRDQLEQLREMLREAYEKDSGRSLQAYAVRLFGEGNKNFFLDSGLASSDSFAFLSGNMQRRILLRYLGRPVEDFYEQGLEENFHYTQAKLEY